jgi:hypothetical protein
VLQEEKRGKRKRSAGTGKKGQKRETREKKTNQQNIQNSELLLRHPNQAFQSRAGMGRQHTI